MIGIIILAVGIILLVIEIILNEEFCFVFGIILFGIGMLWSAIFWIDRFSYPIKLAMLDQKFELISDKIETFTDNANFSASFSDAYNDAVKYNTDLYNEQLSYTCYGKWFDYHDARIMNKKQIDLSQYRIKDPNLSIKINK